MDASLLRTFTGRQLRIALLVALFAFVIVGCGDSEQGVADDPAAGDHGLEDIDDSPSERSFEGDENIPFDRDDPGSEELERAALPPQVEDIFFGYDKFELDAESRTVLQENAVLLRKSDWKILVEGHCDERGTAQYNMALGWKRANEVMRYLVSLGIESGRVETVSYGKERPFVAGDSEQGWAQNRRAHFSIQDAGR